MEHEIIKTYYKSYYNSALVGKLILGSDGVNLIGLWFENQKISVEDKKCIIKSFYRKFNY